MYLQHKRDLRTIRGVAAFVVAGWGFAAGCGSNVTQQVASGGTAGKAGADTPECSPGATRSCVGTGACAGGQRCADTGQWLACGCGGSGAGGSSVAGGGGSSPSDAAGASGLGGAAHGGAGGLFESAGDDAGGSAGQSDLVVDEPCPGAGVAIDCSGQCATKASGCAETCPTYMMLDTVNAGDIVGRLPSHPGMLCTCKQGVASTAYSASVQLKIGSISGKFHVVVQSPWHASDFPLSPTCSVKEAQCGSVTAPDSAGFGGKGVTIWTSDPNAPAINLVAVAGPCP